MIDYDISRFKEKLKLCLRYLYWNAVKNALLHVSICALREFFNVFNNINSCSTKMLVYNVRSKSILLSCSNVLMQAGSPFRSLGFSNEISWVVMIVQIQLNKLACLQCMGLHIAQLVEYCSVNAEATGSNPVEAPKNLFSGYFATA